MYEINNKEFKDTIEHAIAAFTKPLDFIFKKQAKKATNINIKFKTFYEN